MTCDIRHIIPLFQGVKKDFQEAKFKMKNKGEEDLKPWEEL